MGKIPFIFSKKINFLCIIIFFYVTSQKPEIIDYIGKKVFYIIVFAYLIYFIIGMVYDISSNLDKDERNNTDRHNKK